MHVLIRLHVDVHRRTHPPTRAGHNRKSRHGTPHSLQSHQTHFGSHFIAIFHMQISHITLYRHVTNIAFTCSERVAHGDCHDAAAAPTIFQHRSHARAYTHKCDKSDRCICLCLRCWVLAILTLGVCRNSLSNIIQVRVLHRV